MDCFVALGGNIGNVKKNLEEAACRIAHLPGISAFRLSSFYLTKPFYPTPQPDFLNACCRFECTLSPHRLFSSLQEIERALGKPSKPRDHPRIVDLDLLFFGEESIFEKDLIIPHPRWHERLFVVRPLSDIVRFLPFGIDVHKLLEALNDRDLRTVCD